MADLTVTTETATTDANGIAKVLGQIIKHYPYLEAGLSEGMFDDLKPYTVKRLQKAVDNRAEAEVGVAKLLDLAERIVEKAKENA